MIFCVEDDAGIRNMMVYTLNTYGFETMGFSDGAEMFAALEESLPQLIMLDIMLPGEDGMQILAQLRDRRDTREIPVIMATAKGTEYDKVLGLDQGADDYLVKPFGMMEMVARVKAVLRRSAPREETRRLRMGTLELDPEQHLVSVEGERLTLTLKEYELLRLFMENVGKAFTREQLLSRVWGEDYLGETRTVDVHIGTLRTKLKSCGDMIQTVRGVGYRMEERK